MTKQRGDRGFTLIELLLVIVVLGVLATIVVASVSGVRRDSQEAGCKSDAHVLRVAGEAYFALHPATSIPAFDSSDDGYELTLVDQGFLREASRYYDLNWNGDLQAVTGSPCAP